MAMVRGTGARPLDTLLALLSPGGCGWFGGDLPVRHGPQAEPHVTYLDIAATS